MRTIYHERNKHENHRSIAICNDILISSAARPSEKSKILYYSNKPLFQSDQEVQRVLVDQMLPVDNEDENQLKNRILTKVYKYLYQSYSVYKYNRAIILDINLQFFMQQCTNLCLCMIRPVESLWGPVQMKKWDP